MRKAIGILILVAVASVPACGGNSVTGPDPATLTGTWRATRAQYTSGSMSADVIAQGTTMTLTLAAGNTFTLTIVDPGQSGQTTSGTWSASTDVLTIRPTNMSGEIQFDMTLSGSTLTLNGGHMQFDINNDGVPEESVLNMTLVRQ